MYPRESILNQLRPLIGQPIVKVLTGLRGSGKSSALRMLQQVMLDAGIPADHLINLNPERLDSAEIADGRRLQSYIRYRMTNPGMHFVFIDEILAVEGWEDAIAELAADNRCDLYLSSSGVGHLQDALDRALPDRHINICVRPFSFSEYVEVCEHQDPTRAADLSGLVDRYLMDGGLPIQNAALDKDVSGQISQGILHTILYQDTVLRHRIRDTELLNRILRYVLANIGKIYAVKSIGDHLKNRGQRASAETIANYLRALEEAGLIYKVPRYDIRTGMILHNNVKYFFADPGLLQTGRPGSAGLQNTVFLDLERRGYKVATGRIQASSIDFVAERNGRRLYVQILDRRNTPEIIHDAARLFRKIREPAGFLIVTRERPALPAGDHFRCMGLVDFLMTGSLDLDEE